MTDHYFAGVFNLLNGIDDRNRCSRCSTRSSRLVGRFFIATAASDQCKALETMKADFNSVVCFMCSPIVDERNPTPKYNAFQCSATCVIELIY